MSAGLRSRRAQVRLLLRARLANVAQWSAHLSDTQEAGGSNPSVRTVAVAQEKSAGV